MKESAITTDRDVERVWDTATRLQLEYIRLEVPTFAETLRAVRAAYAELRAELEEAGGATRTDDGRRPWPRPADV